MGLMQKAGEQRKHLEEQIQTSSCEFLTIVGGLIGQLQLPQSTMTTPIQPTSQEPPHVSPGAGHHCGPGTINGAIEEQNRPKKRHTNEDHMTIGMEELSTANKVCQIISHNSP